MSASDAGAPASRMGGPPFAHSRRHDLLFALPVAAFYGFAVAGNVLIIHGQWPAAKDWRDALAIAQEIATLAFFGLQVVLLLVRRLPVAKSDETWPRIVATLGANFNFALLLLPRVTLDAPWTIASSVLTLAGTIGSLAALAWLGRSFSIFPDARALVTAGPYRFVRHPLYLAEYVATLGIMLGFRQPWALLIALGTLFFQIKRMDAEEALLGRTYPAYDDYVRRTARLVPGLY